MTKYFLLTFLFLNFIAKFSYGQENNNYLLWSSDRKLTVNDFLIKTKQLESTASFAQFSLNYQVGGFDFLAKNFNKKVKNNFIRSASWLDTTINFFQELKYQQTLFDICEIYARQFRKALKGNKKKLLKGVEIVTQLNADFMTEFSKRRIDYDRETKYGTDELKQNEWEFQIQKELNVLEKFSYIK